MLLEYFVLLFQVFVAMPYIIKLKYVTILDFNYIVMFISGLALHYAIFCSCLYLDVFINKYLHKWTCKFGKCLLIFFSGPVYAFFGISLFIFGYKFDKAILASALENETELMFNFVDFKVVLIFIIVVVIIFFMARKIKLNKKGNIVCFSISMIIIITQLVYIKINDCKVYLKSYPVVAFFDLFGIGRTLEGIRSQPDRKAFEKDPIEIKKHFSYKKDDNLNVILVIGESTRSDFFNKFASILEDKNSINFVKSKSSFMFTRDAVPEILSLDTSDLSGNKIKYSLVNIMSALNFNTNWIGSQGIRGRNDSPYAHFVIDSDIRIYRDNNREMKYDLELIRYLDEIVKKNEAKGGNNFYIIHQYSSHPGYFKRFEPKYARFKNYCKSAALCSTKELYNAYANSIIYTDVVLKEIIERFRDKNTILIYTSDHAVENVSINEDENNLVVPMFVWVSGDMIKIKKVLEDNSKKDHTFSHKKVIESILDCIGVESNLINKKNSICSVEYE